MTSSNNPEEFNPVLWISELVQDEMKGLHDTLVVVRSLCDQMYGLLAQLRGAQELTEQEMDLFIYSVDQVLYVYDQMFPCCEECEEEQERLRAERELDDD